MIDLLTTATVTGASALLFIYWFRYSCLLILSAKSTRDYAAEVAAAHQLSFLHVQAELVEAKKADPHHLERLHRALDRDYALLGQGIRNVADLEDRMLQINYRITEAWFRISRHFSASFACKALDEMCQVLEHCANVMGERATVDAAA